MEKFAIRLRKAANQRKILLLLMYARLGSEIFLQPFLGTLLKPLRKPIVTSKFVSPVIGTFT
jgi:hypothetical protein